MRIRFSGSMFFTALLVFFAGAIVFVALTYPSDARQAPLLIGIATVALGVLLLIGERYPKLLSMMNVSMMQYGGSLEETDELEEVGDREELKRLMVMMGWMVGFFGFVYGVGFLVAIAIFVLAYVKTYARTGWMWSVLVTAGVWVFVYVMFELVIRVELYRGILFGAGPGI